MGLKAIELFHRMPTQLIDSWTYVSLLNACSHAGLIEEARVIFGKIPVKTQKIYTVMVHVLLIARLLCNDGLVDSLLRWIA